MKNYTQLLVFFLIITFSGATYAQTYSWSYAGDHSWYMGRYAHAMAHIGDDKILLFGGHAGGHLDDTYWYDLSSNHWQQVTSLTIRPSFRYHHSMAYIGDDKVLLFGGYHNIEGLRGDTWLFDLSDNSWTLYSPASSPSPRFDHSMVYMGDDKVLLFGGTAGSTNFNNETWIFDLSDNTWTQMYPSTPPSARFSHAMAKIGDQKAMLFGGVKSLSGSGAPQSNQETWVYDFGSNSWIQMNPVQKAWPRYSHSMAFLGGDRAIIYGGYNPSASTPILSDTWIYDLSDNTWMEQSSTITPPALWGHALAEANVDGGDIMLFGGAENFTLSELSQETWVFERLDVYVPDANFEQALIDLGIDSDGTINQSVATSDISGVTYLKINNKNISDLTGIENFISLDTLYCWDNNLTTLDMTKNPALKALNCINNQLTDINVTKNIFLEVLDFAQNQLTSIDISNNTALLYSTCSYNQLTSLNTSQNPNLLMLFCGFNQLQSLDLSQNLNLTRLSCHNNQITGLDLSHHTALTWVECQNNLLSSLDIKNGYNSLTTYFNARSNPSLECIQVDNENDANTGAGSYGTWLKDASCIYSEDCKSALGVDDEQLAQSISFYPNPVANILTINSEIPLTKIEIYSMLGRKVKEVISDFSSIPTSNLSHGVYIVRIYSENGLTAKKLIKN